MLKEFLESEELSPLQKDYRQFFMDMLKKFGAESPAELTDKQKVDFFNAIALFWENGKGSKKDPKDIPDDLIKSESNVKTPEDLFKTLKEQKLKELEESEINETPVGQRGRTSRKEAAEYIADHPEVVKEIEKLIKKVGGKEVLRQIIKIILATDIDQYNFQSNELEHMRMKKISNLMSGFGKFIK